MKERINKWLDSPITWRDSFKASGYVMIGELIVFAGYYGYLKLRDFRYKRERAKEREEALNNWTTTEETEA